MSHDARPGIDWSSRDFWRNDPWGQDESDELVEVPAQKCQAPGCHMDAVVGHMLCSHHTHRCPECMAPAEPSGVPCSAGQMFIFCDEGHKAVIDRPAWMQRRRVLRKRGFY